MNIKNIEVSDEFKQWFESSITKLFMGLKDASDKEFLTDWDLNNAETEVINDFAIKIYEYKLDNKDVNMNQNLVEQRAILSKALKEAALLVPGDGEFINYAYIYLAEAMARMDKIINDKVVVIKEY